MVFDFAPQIEIGAEILSRRGDDQRLHTERPSVRRRRELDAAYHEAKDAERLTRLTQDGYDADEPEWDDDDDQ